MALIRATTIDGRWVEPARWDVNPEIILKEGQEFNISFPVQNDVFFNFISKSQKQDFSVDITDKIKTVTLIFTIKNIKHLLDTENIKPELESLIILVPNNRMVENIFLFLMSPEMCSPKFIEIMKEKT
jgi:hypothetical protein